MVAARNRSSSSRFAVTEDACTFAAVRPCPPSSGASTLPHRVSAGATRIQFSAEPPSPWTSTTVPEPAPSYSS